MATLTAIYWFAHKAYSQSFTGDTATWKLLTKWLRNPPGGNNSLHVSPHFFRRLLMFYLLFHLRPKIGNREKHQGKHRNCTAWKVSKHEVFSGPYFSVFSPNTGKYGPKKTSYLDIFHAVQFLCFPWFFSLFPILDLKCFLATPYFS